MSRLLITHLKSKGCHELILLNRNIDRALNLAQDFPDLEIVCRGLNELEENISISSIVFTSTASEEPIIDLAKIEKLNLSNRLKFIDIGVPRNISNDVKQHEFVKSFDVDDLQEVVSRNQEFRQKIAKEAESLVEEERIIFEDLNPHLFCFRQEDAVLHLMKVSAGLDSLVLGEGQILSQVKKLIYIHLIRIILYKQSLNLESLPQDLMLYQYFY